MRPARPAAPTIPLTFARAPGYAARTGEAGHLFGVAVEGEPVQPVRLERALTLTRRGFLRAAGLVAPALGGAACGPITIGGLLPGQTAELAAWEREWELLIAAAKREGSLSAVSIS